MQQEINYEKKIIIAADKRTATIVPNYNTHITETAMKQHHEFTTMKQ